jgi:hypothetical protein
VSERITGPLYRRVSFPVIAVVAAALLVNAILSDRNGTTPTNLALMSVLFAWLVFWSVRGWRSATLLVGTENVTVRQLARTVTLPWQRIEDFVTEIRPTRMMWLPAVRLRRQVLCVRMRNGRVLGLYEFSCKASDDGRTSVDDIARQLNTLAQMHMPSVGT